MTTTKLILMGLATAFLGLSTTACTTTSINKSVQAAPITYKVGQGATQYASLSTPRSPITRAAPQSYIPARPMPAPVQVAPRQFDQASVDPDLYQNQKLGNTYTVNGKSYTPKHEPKYNTTGVASWYGERFQGMPTVSGEPFNMNDLTAAHKTLPLNSMLFVTNMDNGKTALVRLNDRGPFEGDRLIDLSKGAAEALGINKTANVRVQYAGPADPMASNHAPVRPPVELTRPEERFVEAAPMIPQIAPAPTPQVPFTAPTPAPYVPAAPVAPSAPEAVRAPEVQPDGQITLTIKGPIHVAKYEGTDAKLIRERLQTK